MKKQVFVRVAHSDNHIYLPDSGCRELEKVKIPIQAIHDCSSFKALGIYSYMLMFPKSELFTLGRLSFYNADEIDSILKGIGELIDLRWVQETHLSSQEGWIYLLESLETTTPRYKIGKSKDPWQRLIEIQSTSPVKIRLIALIKTKDMSGLETRLHKEYLSKRLYFSKKKSEWFELSERDISAILSMEGVRLV